MSLTDQQLLELVQRTDASATAAVASTPFTVVVDKQQLQAVATALLSDPSVYFDQLSCATGVDNGPTAATMEVIYHLYSIPFNRSMAIKVILDRATPTVPTLTSTWKSANWLERETFDMYGIVFEGHPDLRRILMPADWEGHPLRKDYVQQELYRDIQVKY